MHHPLRFIALGVLVAAALGYVSSPTLGATPGTINLSWDDCGAFGSSSKTFACNVNTGPTFNFVASFTPPATLPEFLGLQARYSIQSSTSSLPDWWSFGAGYCRGTTALSMSMDYTTGPGSCVDFYGGLGAGGLMYEAGYGGADRARLWVQGAIPLDYRGPVEPTNEYYGFTVRVTRAKSTSSGSCAGCDVPVTIHLDEIQLFQPPEFDNDPVLVSPDHGTTITWSGAVEPPGAPEILSFSPTSGTAGTPVTILGSRFAGATSVTFGNLAAAYLVESDSVISTTAPPNVTTSHLIVTTAAGLDQSDVQFTVPDPPAIEGINLSWDDCGLNGEVNKSVACDSNTGPPFTLVLSFSPPPDLNSVWAAEADIDIVFDSETVPDWWRIGPDQCRGIDGISLDADFTTGPYSCADFLSGNGYASFWLTPDPYSPNRAKLLVGAATPVGSEATVSPNREYYLIRINVMRSKTTGPESCRGCEVPACIVLNSVMLREDQSSNYTVLTMPRDGNFVRWGSPSECPAEQTTAVLATLVRADAENGRIHLEWQTEDVESIMLHRRQDGGAWGPIARLAADGTGRVGYQDVDVVAGASYGYRLAVGISGQEIFLGETEVVVPGGAQGTLALTRATWDRKGVTVSFGLSRAAPARLDLFDVGGRLRASRSLDGLGLGDHEVRLLAESPLGPGVYFMRLSQDGKQVTRRFALSH